MFNIYNKVNVILDDGNHLVEFKYLYGIQDFDDYIILETDVVSGNIERGWVGNLTFRFQGSDLEHPITGGTVRETKTLTNVLCSARTCEYDDNHGIVAWKYKFLKY